MPVPAPIVGLIAVEDDDLGALEPLWNALAAHCARPGMGRVFAARPSVSDAVRSELERLAAARPADWSLLEHDAGADPVGALAQVALRHPGADVAFLGARAVLPEAWDARLAKALHAQPSIGVAAALCDASELHALLERVEGEAPPDPLLVDRAAYCLGDRTFYEAPPAHLACALFRGDALQAGRPAAGEEMGAFLRRLRASGFSCVVCDYLYVGWSGRDPATIDVDGVERSAWLRNCPLGGIRRAVKDALARGLPAVAVPGLDARPVQLHVMHYWGGGLDKWVREFARADTGRTNLILASFRIGDEGGQRIVLYADPFSMVPVRTWDIAPPIRSTATASVEYRRILEQVVAEFSVERVIVSSLIWHALDALELDLPTFLVFHDFYPVCQAINPHFGAPCTSCTREELERCGASNPLNRTFRDLSSAQWDAMRGRFVDIVLRRRLEIVVPSPSVAETLRLLAPRLREAPMRVIAHGIELEAAPLPYPARGSGDRLRVVVPGRFTDLKGAQILRRAAQELRPYADITLLGCGAAGVEAARELGWKAVERYEPRDLPALVAQAAPHAGLLASIVPETFSYTLSELFALGVPPVATALGSFRDRIRDGENGFLFAPYPDALVAAIRRLHAEPQALAAVASRLAAAPPARTAAQMVQDYEPLLPQGGREPARFRVGTGWQSGLTEPYRHLSQAYAELTEAYGRLEKAYGQTREAYEQSRAAYEQTRAAYEQVKAAYDDETNKGRRSR
jgi:glycosyltransferase involved in cell wall biosynthesis